MAVNKAKDYDELNINTEFEPLPPGGYVCQILNAKEETSKAGNNMVVVMLDIVEGEYKDYFRNLFKARKDSAQDPLTVKYPFDAVDYILPEWDGATTRKFKGFNTALEDSGTPTVWGEGYCDNVKGKTVGVIFRRVESEGVGENEGKTYWNCKPFMYRSVDAIRSGDFRVPGDKPLEKKDTGFSSDMPVGFSEVMDDDIPF